MDGIATTEHEQYSLCVHVLKQHAEQNGVQMADCQSIDDVRVIVEDTLFAATGVKANAEYMCDELPSICLHQPPSPLIAFGLLLGPAVLKVASPLIQPVIKGFVYLLAGRECAPAQTA